MGAGGAPGASINRPPLTGFGPEGTELDLERLVCAQSRLRRLRCPSAEPSVNPVRGGLFIEYRAQIFFVFQRRGDVGGRYIGAHPARAQAFNSRFRAAEKQKNGGRGGAWRFYKQATPSGVWTRRHAA